MKSRNERAQQSASYASCAEASSIPDASTGDERSDIASLRPIFSLERRGRISRSAVAGLFAIGDLLTLVPTGWIAHLVAISTDREHASQRLAEGIVAAVVFVATLAAMGGYRSDHFNPRLLRWMLAAWVLAAAMVVATGCLWDGRVVVAHNWLVLWMLLGGCGLLVSRQVLRARLRAWRAQRRLAVRVALVGATEQASKILSDLAQPEGSGDYDVVGLFDDAPIPAKPLGTGLQVGRIADLIRDFERIAPDSVLVALRWNDRKRVVDVCQRLRQLPVDVWVLPELAADAAFAGIPQRVGSRVVLEVSSRPLRGWKGIAKRAEDLLLSALLILFTGPVMLAVAAAIRLCGPGPVLIRQRRYGFANKPFMVLKFRTMHPESADLTGARATVRGDPRVTRIGRALRAISLDELPQLFNVLRGEMSLVGPRPHPIEMRVGNLYYEEAVKFYSARHRIKPGITGLAQINGCRGLVDTLAKAQRRLDYDLHYIENWSLALDLRILCATIAKGFIDESAY